MALISFWGVRWAAACQQTAHTALQVRTAAACTGRRRLRPSLFACGGKVALTCLSALLLYQWYVVRVRRVTHFIRVYAYDLDLVYLAV